MRLPIETPVRWKHQVNSQIMNDIALDQNDKSNLHTLEVKCLKRLEWNKTIGSKMSSNLTNVH